MAESSSTVKNIIRSLHPDAALLAYRTTPLEDGYSTARILFPRRLSTYCTTVSNTHETTPPKSDENLDFCSKRKPPGNSPKNKFDSHHNGHGMQELLPKYRTCVQPSLPANTFQKKIGHPSINPSGCPLDGEIFQRKAAITDGLTYQQKASGSMHFLHKGVLRERTL